MKVFQVCAAETMKVKLDSRSSEHARFRQALIVQRAFRIYHNSHSSSSRRSSKKSKGGTPPALAAASAVASAARIPPWVSDVSAALRKQQQQQQEEDDAKERPSDASSSSTAVTTNNNTRVVPSSMFPLSCAFAQLRNKPYLLPFVLAFGLHFPSAATTHSTVLHAQRCVSVAAASSSSSCSSVSFLSSVSPQPLDLETQHLLLLYRAAYVDPLWRFALPFHLTGVESVDQLRMSLMPRAILREGLQSQRGVSEAQVAVLLRDSENEDSFDSASRTQFADAFSSTRINLSLFPLWNEKSGAAAQSRPSSTVQRSVSNWQHLLDAILLVLSPSDPGFATYATRTIITSSRRQHPKTAQEIDRANYRRDILEYVVEPLLQERGGGYDSSDAALMQTEAIVSSLVKVICRAAESFEECQWLLARLFASRASPMSVDVVSDDPSHQQNSSADGVVVVDDDATSKSAAASDEITAFFSSSLCWSTTVRANSVAANSILEELTDEHQTAACLAAGRLPAPAWFITGCALTTTSYFDRNPPALLLVAAASAYNGRWMEALRALAHASAELRSHSWRESPGELATASTTSSLSTSHDEEASLSPSSSVFHPSSSSSSSPSSSSPSSPQSVLADDQRWECHPQLALFSAVSISMLTPPPFRGRRSSWQAVAPPSPTHRFGPSFSRILKLIKSCFVVTRVPSGAEMRMWSERAGATASLCAFGNRSGAPQQTSRSSVSWADTLRAFHSALGGVTFPALGYSYSAPSKPLLEALARSTIPFFVLRGHATALQSPLLWAYALAAMNISLVSTNKHNNDKNTESLNSALDSLFYLSEGHPAFVPPRQLMHPRLLAILLAQLLKRPLHLDRDAIAASALQQQQSVNNTATASSVGNYNATSTVPELNLLNKVRKLYHLHTRDESRERDFASNQLKHKGRAAGSGVVHSSMWVQETARQRKAITTTQQQDDDGVDGSGGDVSEVVRKEQQQNHDPGDGDRRARRGSDRPSDFFRIPGRSMVRFDDMRMGAPLHYMCNAVYDLCRLHRAGLEIQTTLRMVLVMLQQSASSTYSRQESVSSSAVVVHDDATSPNRDNCGSSDSNNSNRSSTIRSVDQQQQIKHAEQEFDVDLRMAGFFAASLIMKRLTADTMQLYDSNRLARPAIDALIVASAAFAHPACKPDMQAQFPAWKMALRAIASVPTAGVDAWILMPVTVLLEARLTASIAAPDDESDKFLRIPRSPAADVWKHALVLLHEARESAVSRPEESVVHGQLPFAVDEFLYRCLKLKAPLSIAAEAVAICPRGVSAAVGRDLLRRLLEQHEKGAEARRRAMATDAWKIETDAAAKIQQLVKHLGSSPTVSRTK